MNLVSSVSSRLSCKDVYIQLYCIVTCDAPGDKTVVSLFALPCFLSKSRRFAIRQSEGFRAKVWQVYHWRVLQSKGGKFAIQCFVSKSGRIDIDRLEDLKGN